MNDNTHTYPRSVDCAGTPIELAMMVPQDDAKVIAFASALPENDLLFMRRDIRQPKVVAAWTDLIAQGRLASLLAWSGSEVVGCAALIIDPLSWSPHVGELRIVPDYLSLFPGAQEVAHRGRPGPGRQEDVLCGGGGPGPVGDDRDAAGFFIEAMNNSGPQFSADV